MVVEMLAVSEFVLVVYFLGLSSNWLVDERYERNGSWIPELGTDECLELRPFGLPDERNKYVFVYRKILFIIFQGLRSYIEINICDLGGNHRMFGIYILVFILYISRIYASIGRLSVFILIYRIVISYQILFAPAMLACWKYIYI